MSLPTFLKKDLHTYVLAGLLSLFIVFDVEIPDSVASMVDSLLGKVIIILVSLTLLTANPIIGSLGVIAAYLLIKRSERNNSVLVEKFVPSEIKKVREMQRYNSEPLTLEETIIKNQIPYSKNRKNLNPGAKPLDTATYDAANL
jgi:hypothetical protein